MTQHCEPIWCPKDRDPDGSPKLACYNHRILSADSPWAICNEAHPKEVERAYRKFMTNRIAIAKCLRSKNALSALGLDGIGYLFLKLGAVPQIECIRQVFKECVNAKNIPDTWKRFRTVFIFQNGETTLFMAMNAIFVQLKMHQQEKIRIFSNSQKGFVAGVPGCMEHAVMARELMAHAIRSKRDLHMIQIDFTNAFGSVPHGLIQHNMLAMGLPDAQVETVMNVYRGASTVIPVPTGNSPPPPIH
jgi:hypothetical protein